ncbi:hypothetical protein CEP54_011647 [Fusarium duplospermum]|uniref:Xylanolytic transcriptional activator regulatory domain-containing protein n=1 Tax=Fusarium duplospermum TaxID=1325734 RepID=A0A428PDK0_9HYPO|nr:hypothetical protein CEP54_011647 [Fusarium duplospermum]
MNSLSIENLQALVILAFTTIGNGGPSDTWSIIASMTRTVDFLQLTTEGEHAKGRYLVPTMPLSPPMDWVQEEERRRVFWNIFNLDRYCSITTGWSMGICSDKINRRLPANGSYCPSSMGGFSYAVQATEYLNRIATYFLYPEVDFDDQQQVIAWLTRFKELDLQLVHWKMFLPKKWRDPNRAPDTSTGPHDLDHSMTLAHVTHNTSMILLHHRIAYPPSRQRQVVPLPSSCSAETCRLAATKTSNIAETWLRVCPEKIVVAPQIAFCTFISARLLLVHSRYYSEALTPEFWVLVRSLENMSRRWAGVTRGDSGPFPNLAEKYASHLKTIYERYQQDVTYTVAVLDYTENIEHAMSYNERGESLSQDVPPQNISMATSPAVGVTGMVDQPEHADSMPFTAANPDVQELPEDLLAISQALMDQRFAEMDRIITLDDSWFETTAQATDVSQLHVPGWNTADMRFTDLQGDRGNATGRDWQGMQ